jgi:uncharacterized protein
MSWLKVFIPDQVISSYLALSSDTLKQQHISHLLLDIDNTIIPHDEPLADESARNWLNQLQQAGITIILISNNKLPRVKQFAQDVGLPFYASALKPLAGTYQRIMKDYQLDAQQVLCMGDQLMTDVWGAHNAGLRVVWSKPLVTRDLHYTKLNRIVEKWVINRLKKEGWLVDED